MGRLCEVRYLPFVMRRPNTKFKVTFYTGRYTFYQVISRKHISCACLSSGVPVNTSCSIDIRDV